MAKKVILGTDIARDAFKTKVNDNFTELYNKDVSLEGQINNFAPHLTDSVTDADGIHGMKIETGTWTPVVKGATTPGVQTYILQLGEYTRIGKIVVVTFDVIISTVAASIAGALLIDGLPYIPTKDHYSTIGQSADVNLSTGYTYLGMRAERNNSSLNIMLSGTGARNLALVNTIKDGSCLRGEIVYQIA